MEISLNGEKAFLIKTVAGTLICDPANRDEARFAPTSAADDTAVTAVLYSETSAAPVLGSDGKGEAPSIFRPGEYELGDLGLRGIALIGDQSDESRKVVTSYRIDAEGIAVYLLGQPLSAPDNRTMRIVGHVDVLLLDASRLEMDAKSVSNTISSLEPSLVLTNGLDSESGEPGAFLASLLGEIGGGNQQQEPQTRVNVTRSSLPEDRQLIVLKPR